MHVLLQTYQFLFRLSQRRARFMNRAQISTVDAQWS